ncbi:FAD-dependent oxidoreductase [Bacillus kwashiorkori]|uniref:FAD-dependent oxidoreductase n=1 Tax=Bacillus kwashiorkori TaxID=1522318 RepID=UPI000785CEDF|nr:FAD-dependent oxidoreductase [Bacillus kwashiorkori]
MYEIAIIGAGPAGASAALFTAKAGKKTIVFDHGKSATNRAWIENHYGAMDVSGPELLEIGKKQAKQHGVEIVENEVIEMEKGETSFIVKTETSSYEAKYIILATGLLIPLGEKLGVKVVPGTEPRIRHVFEVDESGKTNIPRIWACGTAAGVSMHTIITAGDGAKVAINLISEINGERYVDHDILKK